MLPHQNEHVGRPAVGGKLPKPQRANPPSYRPIHSQLPLARPAREWELRVYRPVARRIRALGLGQLAADRRTTDVFVLVWEHRLADPRSGQAEIDWLTAVAALQSADDLAGGPGARVA